MLKKNLIIIAIAIAGLGLIFTTNAFGQISKRKAKIKQPSGQITEVGFPALDVKSPKSKRKYIGKWEGPDLNASKSTEQRIKLAKSKGYIGETEKNLQASRRNGQRRNNPKTEKEPTSMEIPNLIRAKSKRTKSSWNDRHEDFRQKRPRKRRN